MVAAGVQRVASLQETDDHADLLGIHGAKVPNYGLANHDQAGVRGGPGVLGDIGGNGIRRGGLLHLFRGLHVFTGGPEHGGHAVPVSYTHLTLPTIRLV